MSAKINTSMIVSFLLSPTLIQGKHIYMVFNELKEPKGHNILPDVQKQSISTFTSYSWTKNYNMCNYRSKNCPCIETSFRPPVILTCMNQYGQKALYMLYDTEDFYENLLKRYTTLECQVNPTLIKSSSAILKSIPLAESSQL